MTELIGEGGGGGINVRPSPFGGSQRNNKRMRKNETRHVQDSR